MGYSAFELVWRRECLLLVQFSIASWCMIDWEGKDKTREDLLMARIRQLDQRVLDEARAAENLERSWKENKVYFDEYKRLRGDGILQLRVEDLLLLHTGKRQQPRVLKEKLDDYWCGPCRVRKIPENSTFSYLEEFDGTPLAKTIAGNRLKKFFLGHHSTKQGVDCMRLYVWEKKKIERKKEALKIKIMRWMRMKKMEKRRILNVKRINARWEYLFGNIIWIVMCMGSFFGFTIRG